MTAPWQPLLDVAGTPGDLVSILVGVPWRGPGRARSVLNPDGVPLQLCVSASPRGVTVRWIGDPHTGVRDPSARAAAAVQAAYRLLDETSASAMRGALDLLVAHTLPADRAVLRDGTLWLAGGAGRGAAIYTTLEWGDASTRWDRVAGWLDATLPMSHVATRAIAALRDLALPASAAIEGTHHDDARAKIYLRLGREDGVTVGPDRWRESPDGPAVTGVGDPQLRRALDAAGFDDPSFAWFCARVLGERAIPSRGIILSLAFSLATGALVERKIDICGHCVPRSSAAWSTLCDRLACELAVTPFAPCGDATEVAVIGMAREVGGATRCNLYVKART